MVCSNCILVQRHDLPRIRRSRVERSSFREAPTQEIETDSTRLTASRGLPVHGRSHRIGHCCALLPRKLQRGERASRQLSHPVLVCSVTAGQIGKYVLIHCPASWGGFLADSTAELETLRCSTRGPVVPVSHLLCRLGLLLPISRR